jgi:hypothetical protein
VARNESYSEQARGRVARNEFHSEQARGRVARNEFHSEQARGRVARNESWRGQEYFSSPQSPDRLFNLLSNDYPGTLCSLIK